MEKPTIEKRAGAAIIDYPSVKLWFKKTVHSERASAQTLTRLSRFFESIGSTPNAIIEEWRRVRYDYRERDMFLDKWTEIIEAYYYGLDDSYAPTTKQTTVAPVISYFKHSKMPIEPDIQDRVYVKYHNRDIHREEIARILEHSSLRDRTFFLVMLESGQRPYTLVQLRYKHIKEGFEAQRLPMKIDLPTELIKDRVGKRFTFIGEDGFNSLKEYLAPRREVKDEELIFLPERATRMKKDFLSPETFGNSFSKIVLKLSLDKKVEGGKPKGLRLYCLRKYFRNNIRVSDIGFREFWMGHTFGTDEHYLTRDPERHREEYGKAYESIRIYKTNIPESIEELEKERLEQKKRIEDLERNLLSLKIDQANALQFMEGARRMSSLFLKNVKSDQIKIEDFKQQAKTWKEPPFNLEAFNKGFDRIEKLKKEFRERFPDYITDREEPIEAFWEKWEEKDITDLELVQCPDCGATMIKRKKPIEKKKE